jgi:hypothetical protein
MYIYICIYIYTYSSSNRLLIGFSYLSRCGGLLSRLISLQSTIDKIITPITFRLLCKSIANIVIMIQKKTSYLSILEVDIMDLKYVINKNKNSYIKIDNKGKSSGNDNKDDNDDKLISKEKENEIIIIHLKYLYEELSHLIRTLATLTKQSNENLQICYDENLVCYLLLIFPSPREEIGEITPKSVTLVPKNIVGSILLGNTARCLMPLADDRNRNSNLLYDIKSSLKISLNIDNNDDVIEIIPMHTIERLICAMATCSDIRVRRNISILLAKGCKLPGIRDYIEKFRGMQIMIELQKLL